MLEELFQTYRIIGKSTHGTLIKGPKRTYIWKSSNQQPNSTTKTFWVLQTNVRVSKFLDCKKLEHLLIGLTGTELQCLLDAPGVFRDPLFIDSLRALASFDLKDKQESRLQLVARLQRLRSCLGLNHWNLNLLYTYLGNLKYELAEVRVPIRKVKKFSGWVKNSSAVGSKRSIKRDLEYEIFDTLLTEEIDFYPFLVNKELDFNLLGLSAGSLLYFPLMHHLENEKELPEHMKKLLFFRYL